MVGAPWFVWFNLPNHFFFIFSNYFNQIATSKAFTWERKAASPWLVPAVGMDTAIHATNMWCHLAYLMGDGNTSMVFAVWSTLMVMTTMATIRFHREFMSFGHFMIYLGYL